MEDTHMSDIYQQTNGQASGPSSDRGGEFTVVTRHKSKHKSSYTPFSYFATHSSLNGTVELYYCAKIRRLRGSHTKEHPDRGTALHVANAWLTEHGVRQDAVDVGYANGMINVRFRDNSAGESGSRLAADVGLGRVHKKCEDGVEYEIEWVSNMVDPRDIDEGRVVKVKGFPRKAGEGHTGRQGVEVTTEIDGERRKVGEILRTDDGGWGVVVGPDVEEIKQALLVDKLYAGHTRLRKAALPHREMQAAQNEGRRLEFDGMLLTRESLAQLQELMGSEAVDTYVPTNRMGVRTDVVIVTFKDKPLPLGSEVRVGRQQVRVRQARETTRAQRAERRRQQQHQQRNQAQGSHHGQGRQHPQHHNPGHQHNRGQQSQRQQRGAGPSYHRASQEETRASAQHGQATSQQASEAAPTAAAQEMREMVAAMRHMLVSTQQMMQEHMASTSRLVDNLVEQNARTNRVMGETVGRLVQELTELKVELRARQPREQRMANEQPETQTTTTTTTTTAVAHSNARLSAEDFPPLPAAPARETIEQVHTPPLFENVGARSLSMVHETDTAMTDVVENPPAPQQTSSDPFVVIPSFASGPANAIPDDDATPVVESGDEGEDYPDSPRVPLTPVHVDARADTPLLEGTDDHDTAELERGDTELYVPDAGTVETQTAAEEAAALAAADTLLYSDEDDEDVDMTGADTPPYDEDDSEAGADTPPYDEDDGSGSQESEPFTSNVYAILADVEESPRGVANPGEQRTPSPTSSESSSDPSLRSLEPARKTRRNNDGGRLSTSTVATSHPSKGKRPLSHTPEGTPEGWSKKQQTAANDLSDKLPAYHKMAENERVNLMRVEVAQLASSFDLDRAVVKCLRENELLGLASRKSGSEVVAELLGGYTMLQERYREQESPATEEQDTPPTY